MTAADARSLLFLSCDIVGSTRFKQSMALWQKTFLTFYREFPQVLGDLTAEANFEPDFMLWKPVGDELIFTVHVRDEAEIFHAVRLWLEAMDKYERESLEDTPLATKGGAFIATFPGPDSESSIPRNPTIETSDKGVFELNAEALASRSDDYMYDYFGPSIDTGFRVFSACDKPLLHVVGRGRLGAGPVRCRRRRRRCEVPPTAPPPPRHHSFQGRVERAPLPTVCA